MYTLYFAILAQQTTCPNASFAVSSTASRKWYQSQFNEVRA